LFAKQIELSSFWFESSAFLQSLSCCLLNGLGTPTFNRGNAGSSPVSSTKNNAAMLTGLVLWLPTRMYGFESR